MKGVLKKIFGKRKSVQKTSKLLEAFREQRERILQDKKEVERAEATLVRLLDTNVGKSFKDDIEATLDFYEYRKETLKMMLIALDDLEAKENRRLARN